MSEFTLERPLRIQPLGIYFVIKYNLLLPLRTLTTFKKFILWFILKSRCWKNLTYKYLSMVTHTLVRAIFCGDVTIFVDPLVLSAGAKLMEKDPASWQACGRFHCHTGKLTTLGHAWEYNLLVETRASHGEVRKKLMCNKFSAYYRSLHINNFTQRLTQRLQTHTHTHTHTHTGRVFIVWWYCQLAPQKIVHVWGTDLMLTAKFDRYSVKQ